ncbi:hypothetical protein JCM31598_38550 [Desulfonatronum parangueonense]
MATSKESVVAANLTGNHDLVPKMQWNRKLFGYIQLQDRVLDILSGNITSFYPTGGPASIDSM